MCLGLGDQAAQIGQLCCAITKVTVGLALVTDSVVVYPPMDSKAYDNPIIESWHL